VRRVKERRSLSYIIISPLLNKERGIKGVRLINMLPLINGYLGITKWLFIVLKSDSSYLTSRLLKILSGSCLI